MFGPVYFCGHKVSGGLMCQLSQTHLIAFTQKKNTNGAGEFQIVFARDKNLARRDINKGQTATYAKS